MKKELKWLVASGIISIIIVGLMTGSTFRQIEIQLHDNLVVRDTFSAILFPSFGLWTVTNVWPIAKVTRDSNLVGSILISIINPLMRLFSAILLYYSVDRLLVYKKATRGLIFPAAISDLYFGGDPDSAIRRGVQSTQALLGSM